MKLTATKALRYGGKNLINGDDFEATEKDARLLKAIGSATDAVEKALLTKSLKATADDTGDQKAPAKNEYQTRRLKAKD